MNKKAICFTKSAKALIEHLNDKARATGIEPADIVLADDFSEAKEAVKAAFSCGDAVIFTGAVGIAVRAIADLISDKLSDSPVIVIDDNAEFVIPLIGGHAGGANKLAATIAELLDAIPVITTGTDVNGAFSPDVFAVENRMTIRNREGIKKVSAKALEGKAVTISIKDYPPEEPVDIIIADDTDRQYSLLLSPKPYVVGLGMKKDKDPKELERFVIDRLSENRIGICDVYAFATIDIKQDELALKALSSKYRIPVIAFDKDVLCKAAGDFSSSDFVKDTVGVDNVCERAGFLAAGAHAELVVRKISMDGMTMAVAKR